MKKYLVFKIIFFIFIFNQVSNAQITTTTIVNNFGRIYGEFEDLKLFEKSIFKTSSDKDIFDAETGATLQTKTYGRKVPDCIIYLGNEKDIKAKKAKVIAFTDGFGQYWFEIEPGTYEITGACNGYKSETKKFTIDSGNILYINFKLEKK